MTAGEKRFLIDLLRLGCEGVENWPDNTHGIPDTPGNRKLIKEAEKMRQEKFGGEPPKFDSKRKQILIDIHFLMMWMQKKLAEEIKEELK